MAKSKKRKKGGHKNPLFIVRKKDKNGRFYHIDREGKHRSSDEYRLQWNKGKRMTNKVVRDTIRYTDRHADEKDYKTLAAIREEILKMEEAIEIRKKDLRFRDKADKLIYFELKSAIESDSDKNTVFKILLPDGSNFTGKSAPEAMRIVDDFVDALNKKYREARKKKILISPLPQVSYLHDIEEVKGVKRNIITFDLKNLIGDEDNPEILQFFKSKI